MSYHDPLITGPDPFPADEDLDAHWHQHIYGGRFIRILGWGAAAAFCGLFWALAIVLGWLA